MNIAADAYINNVDTVVNALGLSAVFITFLIPSAIILTFLVVVGKIIKSRKLKKQKLKEQKLEAKRMAKMNKKHGSRNAKVKNNAKNPDKPIVSQDEVIQPIGAYTVVTYDPNNPNMKKSKR